MDNTILELIFEYLWKNKIVKNQSDFSAKIGYNRGYIHNQLKEAEIPHKMQKKLHEVFGISMQYMASNGKEGSMFPADPAPGKTYPENKNDGSYSLVNEDILTWQSTNNQQLMYNLFKTMQDMIKSSDNRWDKLERIIDKVVDTNAILASKIPNYNADDSKKATA